jgi:citrate synthase
MSGRSALDAYADGKAWWETSISEIRRNSIVIRGYPIQELIGNVSYSQMLYLLLCGEIPGERKARLFESVLVAGADHGPRAPSIAAARMAATCGISFNSCVATGINMLGDVHGGAVEKAMKLFYETASEADEAGLADEAVVRSRFEAMMGRKEKIAGIGHQLHDDDPRVTRLRELSGPLIAEGEISGRYLEIAEAYRLALEQRLGKKVTLNIDGISAAVQCELGLPAEAAKGVFALSRGMGIVAHAFEEWMSGVLIKGPCPNRDDLVRYTGPSARQLEKAGEGSV